MELNIKRLGKQIIEECIYPTQRYDNELFGNKNENDANYCYGMINRIHNLVNTKIYSDAFNFNSNGLAENSLTEIIDKFIAEEQQDDFVLRIGFENLGYEFQTREILANAIGRYLLKLAREKLFKNNPVVLILDEAHQFLNKIVVDDFFRQWLLVLLSKYQKRVGNMVCFCV